MRLLPTNVKKKKKKKGKLQHRQPHLCKDGPTQTLQRKSIRITAEPLSQCRLTRSHGEAPRAELGRLTPLWDLRISLGPRRRRMENAKDVSSCREWCATEAVLVGSGAPGSTLVLSAAGVSLASPLAELVLIRSAGGPEIQGVEISRKNEP